LDPVIRIPLGHLCRIGVRQGLFDMPPVALEREAAAAKVSLDPALGDSPH